MSKISQNSQKVNSPIRFELVDEDTKTLGDVILGNVQEFNSGKREWAPMKEYSIWKFEIPIKFYFEIEMPVCARILSFQEQGCNLFIWVIVDVNAATETRAFSIYGTGQPLLSSSMEHLGEYIGTAQQDHGQFVWHLFEVKKKI